jgi:hypothetical protein
VDNRACTGGTRTESAFLRSRSIAQESLTVVDLELGDYMRMAELVDIYADFPLFPPAPPRPPSSPVPSDSA